MRLLLSRIVWYATIGVAFLSGASQAQTEGVPQFGFATENVSGPAGLHPSAPAQLSPAAALVTYQHRLEQQSSDLAGYTATTVIDAELPDSAQKAEFEVRRRYSSPSSLEFTPVRFSGDSFVKSNVIVRLLQAEVDHVHRQEQSQTAINSDNYRFNYKGTVELNGRFVHVYDVKPMHKRVGLFKGKIFVDAATGSLLRAQGRMVKSPSFFVKKIQFVEDYSVIAGFTLSTHIHSEAQTRLVGKAIVDISQWDYQPQSVGASSSLAGVSLVNAAN